MKISTLKKGFTLLELMVVIAIMTIITSVTLFNYSKFNNDLALTNLAYEVALSIREAQVFGGGAKVSGGDDFTKAYGTHFSLNQPTKFISFVDLDADDVYDGDFSSCSGGECLSIYSIPRGNIVKEICLRGASNQLVNCLSATPEIPFNVSFLRPSLDARMHLGFSFIGMADSGSVTITLEAPNGAQKMVRIRNTGQISVENPN